jgi:type IX secretion system PorP/SprF family membrane protein
MKRLSLAFFLGVLCSCVQLRAQQDPLYAQYLNNPILLNPAYTGSHNNWQSTVGYRSQWGGFEGNPTTFNLTSHMPLLDNKVGVGVMVVQDRIGESKNTEFALNYAYKIENNDRSFHFGLSTGFTRYNVDASMIRLQDSGDPNFLSINETKFNTGVGVLLKSEQYVVGVSVPRLLPAKIKTGGSQAEVYNQHFYLYGGYLFLLSERIHFKPSSLFKATQGAPVSVDLNANIEIDETYTVGLLTRNFNTSGILLRARMKNLRLGYAFEVPGNRSVGQRFTSHEISLSVAIAALASHTTSFTNF